MKTYPATGRPLVVFLMALGLGSAWTGAGARAEQPAPVENLTAAPVTDLVQPNGRTRKEGEEGEDESVEIDPVLRLQLLSAILITSPDVIEGNVPRAPNTQSDVVPPPGGTPLPPPPGGGDTPGAPEPASLVLGAIGSGLALLTGLRRRRRTPVAA
jgi:hypothetical protein